MKKVFLLGVLLISTLTMSAQESNVSISGALPIGDAGDFTSFGVNADVNFLWAASEQFDLGLTAGYHHYFGEDYEIVTTGSSLVIEGEDFGFLPIALAGRLNVNESLTFGADVGYGLGLSPEGNDGGFYYAPKIQYGVTPSLDLVLAYKGVNLDGGSFDSLSLGIEFGL